MDMVDFEDNVEVGEEGIGLNMVDIVDTVENRDGQGQVSSSSRQNIVGIEGDNFEPHEGIEFDSHEAAYSFYQEYAKSMGFTTSIKNSRRSKKTKEFIDSKFACSRNGVTPESESGVSRRPSVRKTDCKASMHVKRKRDGKWYLHEFMQLLLHKKENHHLELPSKQRADAVNSMVYEANARVRDPIYGCAGAICHLQNQIGELQAELAKAQAEILNVQCQNASLLSQFSNNDDYEKMNTQNVQENFTQTTLPYDHHFSSSYSDEGVSWEPLWT